MCLHTLQKVPTTASVSNGESMHLLVPRATKPSTILSLQQPKSLYISCAVSKFYETEIEIWAGFGPVGSNEKKFADYEQLLRSVFSCFHRKKKKIEFMQKNVA